MTGAPINPPPSRTVSPQDDPDEAREWIRARLEGTNINTESMLATDYLNHFNEVVMLLEMLPDMPECLDDLKDWAPKSYAEHFQDSVFSDRDLAVEAYGYVPEEYLAPFEQVVANLNAAIGDAVLHAEKALEAGGRDCLQAAVASVMPGIASLLDMASAIINGAVVSLDQGEIDRILDS